MTKNKAKVESSFLAASSAGAAAATAKTSPLKKTSRSSKATPQAEAPVREVALSPEAQIESKTRASKPTALPAKSTAVTHRHKKPEIAPVAELGLRVEISPASAPVPSQRVEPANEEVAQLAYSYYVARGYQPGNQAEDWFRAVSELRAKLNP